MARKESKNKNLLGNIKQKPKKRKKRTPPKKDNLVTKIILPVLVAASSCAFFYYNPKITLPQKKSINKIIFLNKIDFQAKRKIQALFSENFEKLDLKELSHKVQNKFNFKSVSIHINANNEVFFKLSKHRPKLMVKYGKERIFTESQKLIDVDNYSVEGLPILTGLSPIDKIEYKGDRSIYLPINDLEIIQKANLLIEKALGYNIKYKKINYDEFRGFSGQLLKNNYSVVLGFPPFEPKYKKLNRIIYELKTQGKFSANIELDYQGKAFVKKL